MAQPVAVTYAVASGPINAGRFAGGAFSVAVALGDATPGGGWAVQQSSFAGAVGLDDAVAAGGYTTPFNARVAIWGQSNALGLALRSDTAIAPLSSDPDLAAYNANTLTFDRVFMWDGNAFVQLVMGATNAARNANEFGVEFGLAVRWMRETAAGNLYLIKQASGGVSITSFDPPSALNWSNGQNELSQSAAWLSAAGVSIERKAWIWIQGESDKAQTQEWYQTRLQEIIDTLQSLGHIATDSKLVLSQMHPSSFQYGATVAAAKDAIAASDPPRIVAPTFPYFHTGDQIHYNGRSMVQHAYDAYSHIFGAPYLGVV